jgi:hypothetical protein
VLQVSRGVLADLLQQRNSLMILFAATNQHMQMNPVHEARACITDQKDSGCVFEQHLVLGSIEAAQHGASLPCIACKLTGPEHAQLLYWRQATCGGVGLHLCCRQLHSRTNQE